MRKMILWIVLLLILNSGFTASALETSAKAAAVINGDTGEMIYERNAGERLPMASTTKIMTALLLCEQNNLTQEITVTADMLKVEGSSMGLLAGDRVSYRDLLYGMLLASGNDAANVTAFAIDGSLQKFADRMNQKASELGLSDTHFVTPSGLDAEEHYTTASDLARLAFFALRNKDFAEAAASKTATLCYGNPPYKRTLKNHNKLLETVDGVIGVKTGFTKKSGRCLVSAAKRDGKFVIAVTLHDPNDWADHKALLQYGIDTITTTDYMPLSASYSVPVVGGDREALDISIKPFSVNTVKTDQIRSVVELPKFIYAPIENGQTVGRITYYLEDQTIGSVPLCAGTDIPAALSRRSFLERVKENLGYLTAGLKET